MTNNNELNNNYTLDDHSFNHRNGGESHQRDNSMKNIHKIVIVGSGDFGRALLSCLIAGGYSVIMVSRNPSRHKSRIESLGGELLKLEKAVRQCRLIVLAIPFEGFSALSPELFRGKIVIDVSNKSLKYKGRKESLAVQLQEILPFSYIVKTFNTLSAYGLQNSFMQGSKEIPICADNEQAKQTVMGVARKLGYHPVDYGPLSSAKEIEDIPFEFFPMWKSPMIFGICIFTFAFLNLLFTRQLCDNFSINNHWDWSRFNDLLLVDLHCVFGITSITLLACCYLPGVFAAYLQLCRGTKYSIFPCYLDKWLKSRKQLGLLAFFLEVTHTVMALGQLSQSGYMNAWSQFTYIALGSLAFALMMMIAITSLPSVANILSWREFTFVQSKLGWSCLFVSVWHFIFAKWAWILPFTFKCYFIPDPIVIFIIIPGLTIILKIPLLLPFVDSRLTKIRRGTDYSSLLSMAQVV